MRHVFVLSALTIGVLSAGCGLAETSRGWVVKGEVVDAVSGASPAAAYVAIRLVRAGNKLGEDGYANARASGAFETYVHEGFSGAIVFLFFTPPLSPPLGDPPDEVEILVRTATEEGSITVPVDAGAVTRLDEFTGEIQLGVVPVMFRPRTDSTYDTGQSPTAVGLGDVDDDGDVDLVLTTRDDLVGPDKVAVLANNSDGTFGEFISFGAGDGPDSIVVGKLNADDGLDLAVLNGGGDELSVLFNDGQGNFGDGDSYKLDGSPSGRLASADLNGDSLLDLAWASPADDGITVLLNAGGGSFGVGVTFPAGEIPLSVVAADFDGDGDIDLAAVNGGRFTEGDPGGVSILLNVGDGTFTRASSYAAGNGPRSPAAGDLDGDGDVDLAVMNLFSDDISILSNAGDGTFVVSANYPAARAIDLAIADLNDDGHLDLIDLELGTVGNVIVLTNHGDGTFREAVRLTAGADPRRVAVGNLDANSRLDIVVANGNDSVTVFLNPQIP